MTADDATYDSWRRALAEDPLGWDFSELRGYGEDETPWHFGTVAHNLAQVSHHLLDLGTGGGEFLSSLADVAPEDTVATEGWARNVPVATERLRPLGIEVVEYDPDAPGASLPFAEGRFDLVIARHQPFSATDVFRVLSPGGRFATQQIGADNLPELLEAFDLPQPFPEVTLQNIEREITAAGFRVERSDAFRGRAVFTDMISFLRFLRRAPWVAPADLDVDRYREVLVSIAERIADGPFTVGMSRFWILAQTPEARTPPVTDFSKLLGETPDVPQV